MTRHSRTGMTGARRRECNAIGSSRPLSHGRRGLLSDLRRYLSRLAFELMVGRKGRVVPYVSVDRPWCFQSPVEYGTGFIDFAEGS